MKMRKKSIIENLNCYWTMKLMKMRMKKKKNCLNYLTMNYYSKKNCYLNCLNLMSYYLKKNYLINLYLMTNLNYLTKNGYLMTNYCLTTNYWKNLTSYYYLNWMMSLSYSNSKTSLKKNYYYLMMKNWNYSKKKNYLSLMNYCLMTKNYYSMRINLSYYWNLNRKKKNLIGYYCLGWMIGWKIMKSCCLMTMNLMHHTTPARHQCLNGLSYYKAARLQCLMPFIRLLTQ